MTKQISIRYNDNVPPLKTLMKLLALVKTSPYAGHAESHIGRELLTKALAEEMKSGNLKGLLGVVEKATGTPRGGRNPMTYLTKNLKESGDTSVQDQWRERHED